MQSIAKNQQTTAIITTSTATADGSKDQTTFSQKLVISIQYSPCVYYTTIESVLPLHAVYWKLFSSCFFLPINESIKLFLYSQLQLLAACMQLILLPLGKFPRKYQKIIHRQIVCISHIESMISSKQNIYRQNEIPIFLCYFLKGKSIKIDPFCKKYNNIERIDVNIERICICQCLAQ